MENRLIFKQPDQTPSALSQNPDLLTPSKDLEAQRSMVQLQTQTDVSGILSEEEIASKKKESDILYAKNEISKFKNSYNSPDIDENLKNFEKDSKISDSSIKPMTLPLLMEKTKPDYKNWDIFTNDGLAKIFVEIKALNVDIDSPFYKSVFSVLYNANSLVSSGYFDADSKSSLFSNPIRNEADIASINVPDKNFNGKLYLEAFKHIICLQQKLLKVDIDNAVSEEESWGDKQGDKLNGFVGDIAKDVSSALKEKNLPKLLLYGFGGFLAYQAAVHTWSKPIGKGGVAIAGLASLIYLTGNGKAFEKLLGNITGTVTDTYTATKDNITGGVGPVDGLEWLLEKAGVDDNVKNILASMGISTESVAEVIGKGPNSVDNLSMVVNMSSNPASMEIKQKGIDNETLIKLKETKMTDLLNLAKESDKKDPAAKFIPPNSELLGNIFPDLKFVALPTFRTHKELEEIKEKSSILKTGGLNSSHYNYVELGQMLYNIVSAMKLGYDERIRPNEPDYAKLTFDSALESKELEGMTVRHYLNALNEYTQIESIRYISRLKEISESIASKNPGYTDQFELEILGVDMKTGVYDVLVYGMPMRTKQNMTTGGFDLYLNSEVRKGEMIDSSKVPFIRIPDQLKNGIFEEKYSEIVNRDRDRLEKSIPKKTVTVNGKEYKREDMTLGTFKRSSGKWTMNVISKEEMAKGNQVILMVAELKFDTKCNPQLTFIDRVKAKNEMEQYAVLNTPEKQDPNGKFDHLRDLITNKNLVDPAFVDNMEFSAINFDENSNIFEFKLNGLTLNAEYDQNSNEYKLYNPKDTSNLTTDRTTLIVPKELKNNIFVEKFISPNLKDLIKQSGETKIADSIYKTDDKEIGEIFYSSKEKSWKINIVSKNDNSFIIQTTTLTFDSENRPIFGFDKSEQGKMLEEESEKLSQEKEILKDSIAKIPRVLDQNTPFSLNSNFEINEDATKITLKTFGQEASLINEGNNVWNFENILMKADGGYSLKECILMADLSNKVRETRKTVSKDVPIYYKDGEFVFGFKNSLFNVKAKTFLSKQEVIALSQEFPAGKFSNWAQHVIDRTDNSL